MSVNDKMVEAERDHYKNGLQILASTFYKEDQQDYAKHILDTAPRAALAHREAEAVAVRPLHEELIVALSELNAAVGDDINDSRTRRIEELRSALVAPPAQEPVAWLAKPEDAICDVTDRADIARQWEADGITVQPLYAALPAVPSGMVLVPVEILDRFPEINPSNYDHDDACALNSWGIELLTAAQEGR